MNDEQRDPQKDPLWQLLGKAKAPEVSPFFARNVVREIRALQSRPSGAGGAGVLAAWIRRSWKLVSVGSLTAVAAVVITFGTVATHHRAPVEAVAAASQTPAVNSGDYEVISNLDTLVASENSNVWLDDTSSY